jgi:hypothetical protein
MSKIECLLAETYQHNVQVAFTPNIFHLGILNMSPSEITIQFSCEYDSDNTEEQFLWKYNEIYCQTSDVFFKLIDLERITADFGVFQDSSYNRWYHRAIYSIQYVICSVSPFSTFDNLTGFSITSKEINRWIGNTHKQENILQYYENRDNGKFELTEFITGTTLDSSLKCDYNITLYHNSPEYKGGILFPPEITMHYFQPVNINRIITDLFYLADVFSFLIGENITIEKSYLYLGQFLGRPKETYLYYKHIKKEDTTNDNYGVFFPLGTDLRFKHSDTPEFPLKIFQDYFGLNDYNKRLIKQFIKSRIMLNNEDKYLSLFRIAEKLSYRKNFNTKENLENEYKHIKDMFPNNIQILTKTEEMVKLRHDITHANEYIVDEMTLQFYIDAINILSTFLIMKKLLNIDEQIINKVLPRHRLLQRMVVPKVYFSEKEIKEKESIT